VACEGERTCREAAAAECEDERTDRAAAAEALEDEVGVGVDEQGRCSPAAD